MTDNEIIKALECCSKDGMINCRNCPYKKPCNMGRSDMQKDALALINNQTAKIKALQMDNAQLQSDIINATQNNDHIKALYEEEKQKVEKAKQKIIDSYKMLKTAKSKARKEFAERLKEHKIRPEFPWDDFYITESSIDELLEEMEKET